ncbi:hypothetical protein VTN96DRAFT_6766 [Rasamsonia emersonii]|uniref:serine--tRNA ligase n=1 Tax=Rasamsonia emersonii (strain ATCC 16479 / CBS 393.64 / IMI 116815) TaxID=1408163 RepID=A0A0F4YJH4_RASE3|nr:Serine--tRNA ligase [Rasamsonia emersonii CBS 393.64]KKA17733.1 Serine--tRNA ligase [Rasamsonia emersonii CBS 393.64]
MAPSRAPTVAVSRWSRCLRRNFTTSSLRSGDASRPPTAPKPVPDVKFIRDNAELFSRNCIDRNYAAHAEYPYRILQLSKEARQLVEELKKPRNEIKKVERSIAQVAAQGGQSPENKEQLETLRQEAQRLKSETEAKTLRKAQIDEEIQRLALALPNLSSPETPIGEEPRLVRYINFDPENPPSWANQPDPSRSHVSIGASLGLIDFTSSATSTGWGWYFLTNEGALLEHALVQYAMSVALRRGWKAVSPPSLVYSYIAEACGFQPRDRNDEQQIWSIEQTEKEKAKPQRSLAGTAEIPLAAMYAGRDIDVSELPIKLVGASRCYRAEAGARGVDTKGLYRVHEFTKVELFGWADNIRTNSDATPASVTSNPMTDDLFNNLLDTQTEILGSLGLPCRVLEMPTTDLGASAARKRDIEVLFPSRIRLSSEFKPDLETGWGEVTSASICTDYQSRRLGTRVRGGEEKNSRYPHTVNGTAMAVPRVLAAILENGWDEKRGVVVVPEVLRKWMGGLEVIERRQS